MENICIKFFKGGHMTEEEEEIVVDYLSDHRIKINLDTSKEKMCTLALTHKYGSKEKFNEVILNLNKETEIESEKFLSNKYGNLDINTYLKIAMESDDKTLLNMMNISKTHSLKFDDNFFRVYLTRNYPHLLNYKTFNVPYRKYYLDVIYAISVLREKYGIDYTKDKKYNPIEILKGIERIENATPLLLPAYLNRYQ